MKIGPDFQPGLGRDRRGNFYISISGTVTWIILTISPTAAIIKLDAKALYVHSLMNNTSAATMPIFSYSMSQEWRHVVETYRPGIIEFWVALGAQLIAFWIPASIYLAIDLLFPEFSKRNKIQSEQRQPKWAEIKECVAHVFWNTVTSTLQHGAILWALGFKKTLFTVSPELPSARTLALDFVFALIAREILFYYSHRAFHSSALYKRFHKQHHKFTAPMAFAAQYAHPLEHLLANTLPIVLPLALCRAHILSFGLFLSYELWETASVHSGYQFVRFPLPLNPARVHDLHHEKFLVNFGSIGLMDWIHDTGPGGKTTAKLQKRA